MTTLRHGLLLFGLVIQSAAAALSTDPRPNILFLLADEQRADTIAALGNPIIRTPNLDRLARSGLTFTRAYMQGAMNPGTCMPSRAMLLSGRSVFRIDEQLLRDETWPAAFGRAGYTTFMTGKWHNDEHSIYPRFISGPWLDETSSVSKSFQIARSVFIGGMIDPMNAKLSNLANGKMEERMVRPRHSCAIFADEAVRFLSEQRKTPFFSYVAFNAPHDPHIVPDDFAIRYDPAAIPLPPNFLPQHPWDNGEMQIRDETLLPWPRPPDRVRAINAEYYRYISYLDAQIGRILEALAASPFAANTIVVFTADSGVARGSHGLIGKQNVYEHSVRVPLIFCGPGIPAGKQTDAMCYLFDVLPTLGQICGVIAPATSEGIEFSGTLRDPSKPARTELMFAYQDVQRAVRDERWKLICYPLVNQMQLFDLQLDPGETNNLAHRPEHATELAQMLGLLGREQKAFGDVAPLTVKHLRPAEWSPPVPERAAGYQLFARTNLVTWCIVPYDLKRGPEERGQMLEKLGLKKLAYDWRGQDVPRFDEEVAAMKRHGVELIAWWFPFRLDANTQPIVDCIRRNNIHPQLWVPLEGGTAHWRLHQALETTPEVQAKQVERFVAQIKPTAAEVRKLGCQVALYNYGGWTGVPENQIEIIRRLKQDGFDNVGMVYALHHSYGDLDRFAELFPKMKPHLLAISLHGLFKDGDLTRNSLREAPVGQGDLDLGLLRIIKDSGWTGPIGILGEIGNVDIETRLQDQLDGLDWLVPQLDGKAPGPRPVPRAWKPPGSPRAGSRGDTEHAPDRRSDTK